MTVRDDFDRLLTTWLDESAGAGVPDYIDETIDGIARIRQRPVWLSPRRWLPMDVTLPRADVRRPIVLLSFIALLIAAIAVAALIAGSQRRQPAPFGPAATGLYVYDAGGDLFVAGVDGKSVRQLVVGPGDQFGPMWSRDGERVAYWSGAGASSDEIWIVEADGSNPRRVSGDVELRASRIDPAVSWAPDGRSVAFATADGRMYVAPVDGSGPVLVGDDGLLRFDPAWSPDGTLIAFRGEPAVSAPASRGVFVIHPDGMDETRISAAPGSDMPERRPQWSLDGLRVTYHISDRTDMDIFVATRSEAGWQEHRLPTVPAEGDSKDAWPTWSNDGRRISFIRSVEMDHGHVVVVDADGSSERLLESRLIGWAPHCWTPDDRSISAVTAELNVGIGDEPDPGFVVIPVDGLASPVFVSASGRSAFAACSWQRLAP